MLFSPRAVCLSKSLISMWAGLRRVKRTRPCAENNVASSLFCWQKIRPREMWELDHQPPRWFQSTGHPEVNAGPRRSSSSIQSRPETSFYGKSLRKSQSSLSRWRASDPAAHILLLLLSYMLLLISSCRPYCTHPEMSTPSNAVAVFLPLYMFFKLNNKGDSGCFRCIFYTSLRRRQQTNANAPWCETHQWTGGSVSISSGISIFFDNRNGFCADLLKPWNKKTDSSGLIGGTKGEITGTLFCLGSRYVIPTWTNFKKCKKSRYFLQWGREKHKKIHAPHSLTVDGKGRAHEKKRRRKILSSTCDFQHVMVCHSKLMPLR